MLMLARFARTASVPLAVRARAYFASDSRRTIQTVLGLIWLLDGGLQFQSFMYGKGFIQLLTGLSAGQPDWVASSVNWGGPSPPGEQDVFNTRSRWCRWRSASGCSTAARSSQRSRCRSYGRWSCGGSARRSGCCSWRPPDGRLRDGDPLTGAPGAVLLYGLIGADRLAERSPGRLARRPRRTSRLGGPVAADGVAVAGRGWRRERDLRTRSTPRHRG